MDGGEAFITMRIVNRKIRWGKALLHGAASTAFAIVGGFLLMGCPVAGGPGSTLTCLGCHDGVNAPGKPFYFVSAHARIACVECHVGASAHVASGGQGGALINPAKWSFDASFEICRKCHTDTTAQFEKSGHRILQAASCFNCHDPHIPVKTKLATDNNLICQQCHVALGFGNDVAINAHTHHPVDPAGTGASRCVNCHLPPLERNNQTDGPHDHSLMGISPGVSADAIINNLPVPVNSCAGQLGCHDGTVPAAPIFDVDNLALMQLLDGTFQSFVTKKAHP